jgi:hypothetical protein|tara:strand:+ start:984 stop:1163 length:180 start_codon:yes stop_codon:yes gene_type:complete
MEYTKGDLVLVQTSYDTRVPKQYAIVQGQWFNAIKVKFIQTGQVMVYLNHFITPITTET